MGRLVNTHSTYVEGLLKVLTHIAKKSDRIKTIIPGLYYRTKSSVRTGLELRFSTLPNLSTESRNNSKKNLKSNIAETEETSGSFSQKVLARNLDAAQEVYFIYSSDAFTKDDNLPDHLRKIMGKQNCSVVVQKEKNHESSKEGGGMPPRDIHWKTNSKTEQNSKRDFGWKA